ncbi:uncharacterized protein CcaverHIS019_0408940 [Cutaneotrichosporon cavernicola]|uniref:Uncharacterized protein n=1 Tax=Cutaneotrichosporon cavernicola TaxID=279322 RepID=A0AA48L4Z0_9TREE|nr:uncharacterized protein CcaverHIS019_0408940 [Cutaneotrichosporon cavernicola]BEI92074.1 hypothetical protein CcaverHIS019_0408940 [Cutaneotrichosporon cavernicola]BEI99844.1 hypothetical protein CcaverHIS631_0408870 [Cutaneotrichosporon cavernicola]
MKRSASPNPHVLSPVEKRVKPEFHDQATPNAPVVGLQHAGRSAPSVAQALRPHAPFQQDVAPPQFSPTCPPKPRPSSTIFRDTQCEGHQGNYFSPSSSPGHMSPPLRDFIVGSPTRSHFVSPTVHCEYLVSRDNSLSSPSGSLSSHPLISPTFISPTNSNFSVGSAASHLSGTAIAIRTVPTHSLGPASPPPPSSSARKNLQANGYDHNKARCEFQRARAKGESITSNSSPTFAALLNSTLTANKTSSGGPKSQAPPSKKSTMSPSMHHTHSYGSSDVQQPAKTGPIRTSASRGGYPSLTQPGRRFKPPYKSTLTTLSPTVSSSDHNQNYNRSISHDSHYNHSYSARSGSSYNARSGPSYNAGPRKLMSPPHMLSRPSYQPPPLPPAIQLSAYQYPCMHGESSARGSNPQSAADRAIMSLPINPLPTAPTWATEPGSGPLPLPNPPPHPAQPRRPTMSIRPTHSNGFQGPTNYHDQHITGPNFRPSSRSTHSPAPSADNATPSPSTVQTQPQSMVNPSPATDHASPFVTRTSTSPTPLLSRGTTLSASLSPTPLSALTLGNNNNTLNVAPEQMATHLQILAAHVGLDVHFTPKSSPPPPPLSKKGLSKTPESLHTTTPKLTPPRTSGGKNSRRPSFAALLPGCKTAPPKHSRPGQWTLEKRLIFVDRLLTAGYKSLSLSDLASELELKKKQLVNQLTPGRTGSIRELCMNAAARLHEPCTDCKKKQAISKRKADSEGLADFLLRGVSERIDEDEGELELDDNDGNESLEEEDELPDEDVKKDESQ